MTAKAKAPKPVTKLQATYGGKPLPMVEQWVRNYVGLSLDEMHPLDWAHLELDVKQELITTPYGQPVRARFLEGVAKYISHRYMLGMI